VFAKVGVQNKIHRIKNTLSSYNQSDSPMKKKTFVWLMTWLSFHVSAQISDAPAAVINHAQSIRQGGFSHDGILFLTASADLTIKVWEVLTGRLLKTLSGHHGGVNTAEFSQDDKQIVSASEDSTARIWSTLSAATIHILFSPEGPVRTAVFSPDGLQVATASADQINIWNGVTGTFNGTILDLADNKEMSLQFQPERPKDAGLSDQSGSCDMGC
jgi:WD40 repeat protein